MGTFKIILEFVFGLALLPVAGGFVAYVLADPNLSGILGFSLLMSFAVFVLAGIIIYKALKDSGLLE